MGEQEDWTCGKGLAANATLPERVGAVLAAMAEVLRVHMEALDLDDEASRREHDAYGSVSQQLSETASQLEGVAREMTTYHDLPMGRHEMEAMTRPNVSESFAEFVARKQDLLTLLQETIERDRAMLAQMTE